MSTDLQWLLLRNHNSFVVKRPQTGARIFSTEPGNLKNLHSQKYSGLTNAKVVAISQDKETSAIKLSTRKTKASPTQVKAAYQTRTIKASSGPRRTAGVVAKAVANYRPDLRTVALGRASRLASTKNTKPAKAKAPRRKADREAESA